MNSYRILCNILVLLLFLGNQGFSQGQSSEVTVFYDGFVDNNNDWPIKSSSDVSFNIYGGFYYFEHLRTTKGWSVHKTIIVEEDRNFKIEAGIKKISGIGPTSEKKLAKEGIKDVDDFLKANNAKLKKLLGNVDIKKMKRAKIYR